MNVLLVFLFTLTCFLKTSFGTVVLKKHRLPEVALKSNHDLYFPKQSWQQKKVVENARHYAKILSKRARVSVLSLLGSKKTKEYLKLFDDGSELYKLKDSELYLKMKKELYHAEFATAFSDPNSVKDEGNCGFNVNIDDERYRNASFFYNQWVAQALKIIPVDGANNVFPETSEVNYFHFFPAFSNLSKPDLETASHRPIYASLNMFRNSGGNPQCGPVTAIFSRKYVANDAVVAPVDTGLFVGFCDKDGQQNSTGKVADILKVPCYLCDGWTRKAEGKNEKYREIGSPEYMDHLLMPFSTTYNVTQDIAKENYREYNLARLLIRLLSPYTYHQKKLKRDIVKLNLMENIWGYFEINIALAIKYPMGIKLMIGMFDKYFGTPEGDTLRYWCIEKGWPLAWAHNPTASFSKFGPDMSIPGKEGITAKDLAKGVEGANFRILDPFVLKQVSLGFNSTNDNDLDGTNFKITFDESEKLFKDLWLQVQSPTPRKINQQSKMDYYWQTFVIDTGLSLSPLAIEPLFSDSCHDIDCIGIRIVDGKCICKPPLHR